MKQPGNDTADAVLRKLDEQYQKYKYMEVNLVQKKMRFEEFSLCLVKGCFVSMKIALHFSELVQTGATSTTASKALVCLPVIGGLYWLQNVNVLSIIVAIYF